MEEQALAQLTTARGILLAARIDAVADRWHLDERAVPVLTDQAGRTADPRQHAGRTVRALAGRRVLGRRAGGGLKALQLAR